MRAFSTMLKTEIKLSVRDMNMPIFAIFIPVLVTVLIGIIYGTKPAFDGAGYSFMAQSFGALSTIAICAGGVMGLPLMVSDYRGKKILKRFKVTPVNPALILTVQVTLYAVYSVVSLVLVYATAAIFFGYRINGNLLYFLGSFLLVMLSVFSVGMMVGGIAPNMKTASTVATLLYFPMMIFSGATLPYEVMPEPLQKAADFLPLTQGIKLLKAASLGTAADAVTVPIIIMVVLAAACVSVSIRFFKWE